MLTPIFCLAQPDYAPALWAPAASGHWYTTGYGHKFCVIHDMEGYYLSTISYIQQSGTQVSIHYCVNSLQNGSDSQGHAENRPNDPPAGQITQMVREQYYAWHALCWNQYSLGTEHEGFAGNPAWYSDAMYRASAALQRHLCETWGIPKDRNHIIGHGEWQNAAWLSWLAGSGIGMSGTCSNPSQSHTDPGVYWNWDYFMALILDAPGAPSNLAAASLSTTQIRLTWRDNATNETGFKIERALSLNGPWSQIAIVGVNVAAYVSGGLAPSTTYYYRIRAYNANGDSAYTEIQSATTANSPPVLAVIGDKTVVETTPLQFTVSASDSAVGQAALITDFESFASGASEVLFRSPGYSGSSRGVDSAVAASTTVVGSFPAGHASARVLKATWGFAAAATEPWLRLTTASAPVLPNPVIDFTQVLRFDVFCDKPIRLGIGLRETTVAAGAAIGSNGGGTGSLEWAGVTNVTGTGAPVPSRIIPAGSWQTVTFDLPYESIRNFVGGNDVLSTPSGLGVLEHLAIVPVSSAGGVYNLYLDNFAVVNSNVLTFSLAAGAPAGATIDARSGAFSWTPTEAQGPGVFALTFRASDNGTPPLSDLETIQVAVLESNLPPVLAAISDQTITEGLPLAFFLTASDPDLPANQLTFSLDPGAPAGAEVDPVTGAFLWVPSEEQGPGIYTITARVTDDSPEAVNRKQLSATRAFSVTVLESNRPPILAAIPDQTMVVGEVLWVTNSASDPDLPANTLRFSLDPGSPAGAVLDPVSGVLSWLAPLAAANTTNGFKVRVTDDGTPPLSDLRTFQVLVLPESIRATVTWAGPDIILGWNAVPGQTYRVQFKAGLEAAEWHELPGQITATNSTCVVSDSVQSGARYYRIIAGP